MEKKIHLAHYFKFLWEEPDLIVVVGAGSKINQGRRAYNEHHHITAENPAHAARLERLFAATGLAAVSLAERESWGWSISLPGLPLGLFCAVEPEGMVSGRILKSAKESCQAVVQRQKPQTAIAQSHFTLDNADPVNAVERYFEEAEQSLVRVAVDENCRGVLIRPLPGGDFKAVNNLTDDELLARFFPPAENKTLKQLDEVLLFYTCRCSEEMILKMITDLPQDRRKELWQDLDHLTADCPRCARRFTVRRGR